MRLSGQITIEYLAVFGLVILLFTATTYNTAVSTNRLNAQVTVQSARQVAEGFTILASLAAHSRVRPQLTLPPYLANGVNYSISFSNSSLTLNWSAPSPGSIVKIVPATEIVDSTGAINFTLAPGSTYKVQPQTGADGIEVIKV